MFNDQTEDVSPYLTGISTDNQKNTIRAVESVMNSDALLFTAGAGMGVDSGLPYYRGPEDLWEAYPPLKELGLTFTSICNPQWFKDNPELLWGFYADRFNLYSRTIPHEGFQILKSWGDKMSKSYFVFTSNVDGHFQKAGFPKDKITEIHGSINYLQCIDADKFSDIWPVPSDFNPNVDLKTLRAEKPLPRGPPGENICLARPNISMFGPDCSWASRRTDVQYEKFRRFQKTLKNAKLTVIEFGCGLTHPTVRNLGESQLKDNIVKEGVLIRVNPSQLEVRVPEEEKNIGIELGALATIKAMDGLLRDKGWL